MNRSQIFIATVLFITGLILFVAIVLTVVLYIESNKNDDNNESTLSPTNSPTNSPTSQYLLYDDFNGDAVNTDIWETNAGSPANAFTIEVADGSIKFIELIAGNEFDGVHIRSKKTFESPLIITGQFELTGADSDPYIMISKQKTEATYNNTKADSITFMFWDPPASYFKIYGSSTPVQGGECTTKPLSNVYDIRVTINNDNVVIDEVNSNCPSVELAESLSGPFYVYFGGDADVNDPNNVQDTKWNYIQIERP